MTFRLSLISLGLAAWLTISASAADVEVLARGPVHEGYAEPSEREPTATPVIPKEPPKPIEELPPDQKPDGENVQWIPGYFAWDEEKKDYIWISGFWRNAPPGRTWVAGSWRKGADGWQWTGGFWANAKGGDKAQTDYLPQPPKPLDDEGATTPQPSDNHTYVPGTWVWRDRWVWQPGYWTEHRPGWVWVAAHYRWTPAGHIFIDGYWDYPLAERGLLFAPAYIPPAVYAQPAYVYTPTVVVREECLFGAFFVRRGFGCYYFGDYFAPTYASLGFCSWGGHVSASIRIGGWCDPLFSYYSCGYRSDPFWRTGCNDLYVGRYRGDYLCPPRTLVQQNTVINNITNVNNSTNVNLNNVTMVSSLNDVRANSRRNLQTVSDSERRSQAQTARGVREIADRRATAETQLASAAKPGTQTSPRSINLDIPQRPTAGRTGPTAKGIDPKPAVLPTAPKPAAVGRVDPRPTGTAAPRPGNVPTVDPGTKGTARPPVAGKVDSSPKPDLRPTPRVEPKGTAGTPGSKSDVAKSPATSPTPKPATVAPSTSPSAPRPATLPSTPTPRPATLPSTPRPATVAPAPKPAAISPAPRPTPRPATVAPTPRPPVSSPAPRPTQPSIPRAAAPAMPRVAPSAAARPPVSRPAPAPARSAAPPAMSRPAPRPAMSRPAPRPAMPSVSRPAPAIRQPAAAPARPAAPRKR